jgi:hypothetical protein
MSGDRPISGLRVLVAILTDVLFWGILAIAVAGWLGALIITWEWDLIGWRRDLLRSLPVLAILPAVVVLRKYHRRTISNAQRCRSIEPIQ